jgi:vitamin B12 transporter
VLRNKIFKWVSSIVVAASLSSNARSQPAINQPVTELERTIVIATRTPIDLDLAIAPVAVIDRDEIAGMQNTDIADVLRFQAGFDVGRNGGPGQPTSLFIRGSDSNHSLVLFDGVRINPGTIGGAALQNVPTELVERIEILRGPRSSLYGSDAIGGVINIVTRAPHQGFELSAGGGRYGSRQLSVAAGTRFGSQFVSGVASFDDTDGFPTRTLKIGGIEQFPQIDRGYRNVSTKLRWGLDLDGWQLGAQYWRAAGNSEYLGFDDNFNNALADEHFLNQTASIDLSGSPRDGWTTHLTLSHMTDDIEQRGVTSLVGASAGHAIDSADFAKTQRTNLDWQNDVALGSLQTVTLGTTLSSERDSTQSFGAGFAETTHLNLFYAQDQIRWGHTAALLAVSLTDHSSFGSEWTWNAEVGHDLTAHWRITAMAGKAFRAPDATDRFSIFGGNPNLAPEIGRNTEIGLHFNPRPGQRLSLSAFRNDVRDLIDYVVLDPITFLGENRNVARARIQGVELSYDYVSAEWRARLGLSAQKPRDLATDEPLLRRADRSGTLSLTRHWQRFDLGADLLVSGARRDFGFPDPVRLGGYTLVNLHSAIRVTPHWSFSARLENALDRDYRLADSYRVPGRAVYANLRYALD